MAPAALPSPPSQSTPMRAARERREAALMGAPLSRELLRYAQQGAARARVARHFRRLGPLLFADDAQRGARGGGHDRQVRKRRIDRCCTLHETLGQAILERVEADD